MSFLGWWSVYLGGVWLQTAVMEMTLRKLQRLDTSFRAMGELAPSTERHQICGTCVAFLYHDDNTHIATLFYLKTELLVRYEADQSQFHSRQALLCALVTVRYGFDKAARDLTRFAWEKQRVAGGFGGGHLSKMVISDWSVIAKSGGSQDIWKLAAVCWRPWLSWHRIAQEYCSCLVSLGLAQCVWL